MNLMQGEAKQTERRRGMREKEEQAEKKKKKKKNSRIKTKQNRIGKK